MSFVTTRPEALAAAAGNLQAIASALAAQNAAGAAPTTGVIPAAADEVSALQAAQFAAYGELYQQVSAQATAIQEALVQTLRTSADSYGDTEATNAAAADSSSGLDTISGAGTAGLTQVSNFGSAASDLLQLGSSGFLAPGALAKGGLQAVALDGSAAAMLANTAQPAGSAAAVSPAVLASAGQASSIKGLSVPPNWAGAAGAAANSAPAPMRAAGWATTAPHSAPVAAMPAGMPSAASAQRGGLAFGAPRYGVKPKVMPRPAVV